jgi:hypothetical protein
MSFHELKLKCPIKECPYCIETKPKWEDIEDWTKKREELIMHILDSHPPYLMAFVAYEKAYSDSLSDYEE